MCHIKHVPYQTCAISNMCHTKHVSYQTCVISNMCHIKHVSYQTCVISNMCHIKHVSYQTCVISNMCHIKHVSYQTCVISNMCHIKHGMIVILLQFSLLSEKEWDKGDHQHQPDGVSHKCLIRSTVKQQQAKYGMWKSRSIIRVRSIGPHPVLKYSSQKRWVEKSKSIVLPSSTIISGITMVANMATAPWGTWVVWPTLYTLHFTRVVSSGLQEKVTGNKA